MSILWASASVVKFVLLASRLDEIFQTIIPVTISSATTSTSLLPAPQVVTNPFRTSHSNSTATQTVARLTMTRPRDSDGGGAPDTQESRDEPAPEVLAPQNLSMRCHLVQLNWTQTQFEALKRSIMEFGNDIMHINSLRGLSVTRKSLVAYWNQLVWFFYGEGNATSNRLESQVSFSQTWA